MLTRRGRCGDPAWGAPAPPPAQHPKFHALCFDVPLHCLSSYLATLAVVRPSPPFGEGRPCTRIPRPECLLLFRSFPERFQGAEGESGSTSCLGVPATRCLLLQSRTRTRRLRQPLAAATAAALT